MKPIKCITHFEYKERQQDRVLNILENIIHQYEIVRLAKVKQILLAPKLFFKFVDELKEDVTDPNFTCDEKTILSYTTAVTKHSINILSIPERLREPINSPIRVYFETMGETLIEK